MEKDWDNNLLTAEDRLRMLDWNPYNNDGGGDKYDAFIKWYIISFEAGVYSISLRLAKLLKNEKGMDKEEIRELLNKAMGKEVLKKKDNDNQ